MPKIKTFYLLLVVISLLTSCNGSFSKGTGNNLTDLGNISEEDDATVNIIEQSKPSIMIIPSDQLLRKKGALKSQTIDGKEYIIRDYQSYLAKEDNAKYIIRYIQRKFVEKDFPLNDLEQTLKNLTTMEMSNEANNITLDAKAALLMTATPDYVIELDYSFEYPQHLRDHIKELSCHISLIDPTTEKVLSSEIMTGRGNTIESALKETRGKEFDEFSENIQKEFINTIRKGREVTVRISIDSECDIDLEDLSPSGDTLSDLIIDYMDTHSKKGSYSLERNSSTEIYFKNVRIQNIESDGTQFNAYKWARQMCRDLRNEAGIEAVNRSQSLNEIHIIIKNKK